MQTGNIVLGDPRLEDLGCYSYGYFRYLQVYTFVRKYGNEMRYYVDDESYLYKDPISKAKKPDVLVQDEEKLIPGREYYMRICGVNKKQTPPTLYQKLWVTPFVVNAPLYKVLEGLSWHHKPQVNPLRLMSTNNSVATKAGDYYMYRSPFLPDYKASELPAQVIVGVCGVPYIFNLMDGASTTVISESEAQKFTADVVYYEGIHVGLDLLHNKERKPYWGEFSINFIFSLKAVRQMLTVDPDLVFTPVYATRNMQDYAQNVDNLERTTDWLDEHKSCAYKLRDYCRKWGKVYDSERFDRDPPRFW